MFGKMKSDDNFFFFNHFQKVFALSRQCCRCLPWLPTGLVLVELAVPVGSGAPAQSWGLYSVPSKASTVKHVARS